MIKRITILLGWIVVITNVGLFLEPFLLLHLSMHMTNLSVFTRLLFCPLTVILPGAGLSAAGLRTVGIYQLINICLGIGIICLAKPTRLIFVFYQGIVNVPIALLVVFGLGLGSSESMPSYQATILFVSALIWTILAHSLTITYFFLPSVKRLFQSDETS